MTRGYSCWCGDQSSNSLLLTTPSLSTGWPIRSMMVAPIGICTLGQSQCAPFRKDCLVLYLLTDLPDDLSQRVSCSDQGRFVTELLLCHGGLPLVDQLGHFAGFQMEVAVLLNQLGEQRQASPTGAASSIDPLPQLAAIVAPGKFNVHLQRA